MSTGPNVVARFDDPDKEALVKVAAWMQRSQSDVLRVLVRETWKLMQEEQVMKIKSKKVFRPSKRSLRSVEVV